MKDPAFTGDVRGLSTTSDPRCTPGGRSKRRQSALKIWKHLHTITYNTGSLSELRTHQIIREFEQKQVSIALIQGTRNPFTGERLIGNYKLFYEGSGTSNLDMHAGVMIVIHVKLMQHAKVTKIPACPHRALVVRIKTEYVDIALISAYAPGDHLHRKPRHEFWKSLTGTIRQLPKRTILVTGIDANGHIGRDGTGTVGCSGAERWTENGQSLNETAEACNMTALNTQPNCKNPGWTWKRADGKGNGRIDYLLVSTSRTGQVTSNVGAISWDELDREGSPTDHRPVSAIFDFRFNDELGRQTQREGYEPGIMSQFNRTLSQAFSAHRDERQNKFTLKKKPVNPEHLDLAKCMLDSFNSDISECWDESDDIDTKVEKLDRSATNVFNEFCRKSKPVIVKQKYMTPEIVDEVSECHNKWREVKKIGDRYLTTGWEKTYREFAQLRQQEPSTDATPPINDIPNEQRERFCYLWDEWSKLRKRVRVKVQKAKSTYFTELVNNADGGTETNVWKAIDIIAPKKRNKRQAMKKVNGTWCVEPEDTLSEIKQFATDELKQLPVEDFVHPPPPGEWVPNTLTEPSAFDVIEGLHKTNPNKSGTGWSVPNKLWVVLEEGVCDKFAEVWQQIGKQRQFPKQWRKQKCAWIDKPGKKSHTIKDKRGIMLADGACKAYSNWTQKRTRNNMRNKWRSDCFGAIPGRGTTQALLKVFATRNQIKRKQISSITFMGDGIKAFDRIDRRKVLDRVHATLEDEDLSWRHEVRHDHVYVASVEGEKELVMAMVDGVPQGDPNGPVLYVIGYTGVAEDIDCERESKEYQGLLFENNLGPPGQFVDICRTTFVDDHKETHLIDTIGKTAEEVLEQIRERVLEIVNNQARWKVTNNMTKTIIMVELFGKGFRKIRKTIGSHINICEGVDIKVVRNNKYLGVQVGGGDESNNLEVTQRIKSAGEAVARLNRFWKVKGVTEATKVRAYCQLVRTILVYGIEARVLSRAQVTRLECFQTRVLRRIGKSQSHITRESNDELRTRLEVPSVDSHICRTRLRMWQKLLANPIDSVISAVTGRIMGAQKWGSEPHVKQLTNDLGVLAERGGTGH